MRMLKAAGAAAIVAAFGAGLVQAQPAPAPQTPPAVPPAPVMPVPDAQEEPPPAPGEVTPAPPLVYKQPEPTPIFPEAPVEPAPPPEPEEEAAPKVTETPPVAPDKRARHQAAVIQALDKITAETMRFEAKVGVPVRYKGLVFTVRACETSAPDEPMKDSAAYLEVRAEPRAQTEQRPSRQVFKGWMFANSPGLNPLEHPVYDAWLIACKA